MTFKQYLIGTCLGCKNSFQRRKHVPINLTFTLTLDRNSSEPEDDFDDLDNKYELEIEVSSLDDILANIHHYVEKLIGNEEIMHLDYLVLFKSEKAVRAEA
ncbi:hypothetical protein C1645_822009 [Glomus cerebriforme]|uniref:Uncharacterized protein n=1 Tax=Glomus cerebriforme TaxID=658196 RepID=A0A397T3P5_9GLOM|nr:hypothetical protein C1645_822009 [Glomus cerebriforme]